jgi:hypothetical protein
VKVIYEGFAYPGEITSIEGEDDVQVNVIYPVQEIQKNLWK